MKTNYLFAIFLSLTAFLTSCNCDEFVPFGEEGASGDGESFKIVDSNSGFVGGSVSLAEIVLFFNEAIDTNNTDDFDDIIFLEGMERTSVTILEGGRSIRIQGIPTDCGTVNNTIQCQAGLLVYTIESFGILSTSGKYLDGDCDGSPGGEYRNSFVFLE